MWPANFFSCIWFSQNKNSLILVSLTLVLGSESWDFWSSLSPRKKKKKKKLQQYGNIEWKNMHNILKARVKKGKHKILFLAFRWTWFLFKRHFECASHMPNSNLMAPFLPPSLSPTYTFTPSTTLRLECCHYGTIHGFKMLRTRLMVPSPIICLG